MNQCAATSTRVASVETQVTSRRRELHTRRKGTSDESELCISRASSWRSFPARRAVHELKIGCLENPRRTGVERDRKRVALSSTQVAEDPT
jgi:hypothetical protein